MSSSEEHLEDDVLSIMHKATEKALAEASRKDNRMGQALPSVKANGNGFEPKCKTCNFPGHEEYDQKCIGDEITKSDYAKIVGCSVPSITRHLGNHIPRKLVMASAAAAVTNADNLLDQIGYYEAEARRYKEGAESHGDINLALKAVDRALKCIEIYAKVQGLIRDMPQINLTKVSIYGSSEWFAVGSILSRILAPYPEIRAEVAKELLALQEASK